MPSTRITLKDIASEAGVSLMTVSLSLRNQPKIPEQTRQRIQEIAARLGYRPDPALSALIAHRRDAQIKVDGASIAFLTNWKTENDWLGTYAEEYFLGARARAERVGYHLEPFWLGACRNARHASSVLQARGISALLVAPLPAGAAHLSFPWKDFHAVAMGLSLLRPTLHRVAHNYFSSTQLALHHLRRGGYHKIAIALPGRVSSLTEHRIRAAALEHAYTRGKQDIILFCDEAARDAQTFLSWMKEHRPEAVLSMQNHHFTWLREAGVRIPKDLGFASLHVPVADAEMSGILYGSAQIGDAAVDSLHTLVQTNEKGIPNWPRQISIVGQWRSGRTLHGLK